jgi:hypothetical protein
MKIIFLDFDGVLNSQQFTQQFQGGFGMSQVDPTAAARLEKLVKATGAKIVISSSWRTIFSIDQIKKILQKVGAPGAAAAVIDRTPVGQGNRGQEIQDWLDLDPERAVVDPKHQNTQAYVILDDSNQMTPQQQPRLVHTNPQYGLTDEDVIEAVSILRMGS